MKLTRRGFLKSSSAVATAGFLPSLGLANTGRDIQFIPSAGQTGAFWGMVEKGKLTKAIPRTEQSNPSHGI